MKIKLRTKSKNVKAKIPYKKPVLVRFGSLGESPGKPNSPASACAGWSCKSRFVK